MILVRRLQSPSIQSGEPEQEACIAIELIAGGASTDLCGTTAEVEAALSSEKGAANEFRLVLVEVQPVQISTESDVMAPLGPVKISYILILRVAPIVRHVIVVGPDI